MDHRASLYHQEYYQYQKYLLKLSRDYKLLKFQFSKFRLSEGTTVYWKSKSSSSLTRNNSLELVLEHALRLSLLYFWTFISLCALLFTESYTGVMTVEIRWKKATINAFSVCFYPWLFGLVHRDDFSMRLEGIETLKHHRVCRPPFGKV